MHGKKNIQYSNNGVLFKNNLKNCENNLNFEYNFIAQSLIFSNVF